MTRTVLQALCKTVDEGPVLGPYAFARTGPKTSRAVYYKNVRPSALKLQANLSLNWSYDIILIDYVRSGWMGKYLALPLSQ